jgi:uncharacterized protein
MTTTINGKALETERKIPAPTVYPDNTAFWDACNAGKLLIKHCAACNKPHWYPRPQCPFCMSSDTVLTNIVDCDLDAIKIGARVKVVFRESDGGPKVPAFTLA